MKVENAKRVIGRNDLIRFRNIRQKNYNTIDELKMMQHAASLTETKRCEFIHIHHSSVHTLIIWAQSEQLTCFLLNTS